MNPDWKLVYSPRASKWLRKADPQVARRIRDALTILAQSGQPRSVGAPLTGNLAGLWKIRVGNYRAICDIQDDRLVILVLEARHRSEIYTQHSV